VSVPDSPPVTDRVTDACVSERVRMSYPDALTETDRLADARRNYNRLDCHIGNKAAVDTVCARRLITYIRAGSASLCCSSLALLHA
jgi:hypothetical protein